MTPSLEPAHRTLPAHIFVIGDVHLHANAQPAVAHDLQRLITQLVHDQPGCCIVLNGDVFDLDRLQGERAGGVGDEQAAERVHRVLQAFPTLGKALQAHVTSGGLLLFVAGNHDAEVLLPAVQRMLCRLLGDEQACNVRVLESVKLQDVLIEHGHQADPDCAFFPDTHQAISKRRLSAFPLASLLTRLYLSTVPQLDAMGDNYKTPLPMLTKILRDYGLGALVMIVRYPIAGMRIAWQSVLARVRHDVPAPGAASMSSPWAVARRLYLDRYFCMVTAVALLIGSATRLWSGRLAWVALGLLMLLAIPPRRRKRFDQRDVRQCDSKAHALVAQGARVVVFGHTHQPFVTRLGNAIYANHGAFSLPVPANTKGLVCATSETAPQPLRDARPYLSITTEPLNCVLRGFI